MSEVSLRRVEALIQEVADAVEVLLDMALFPGRIHSQDDDAFPEHARYLLSIRNLADEFGLRAERASREVSKGEDR